MAGERDADEGLHEKWDNSDYVTANPTDDPQYPDGSYYVSYGNDDDGHVTQVFDEDGDQIGGATGVDVDEDDDE
ncbi:hypothetical protein [Streptomyces sp. NPDC051452]|uniref:hypothetical protein n=1 Tax=Streptomyces sp. NPDC051452 TaxID=3365654 RepID=UPI003793583D